MAELSAEEWNEKGKKHLERGNLDFAIAAFERAIREDEKFADAWFNKGDALKRQGKLRGADKFLDKALKLYDDILKEDQDNSDAWYWQGRIFFLKEDYETATDCYKQALKINPEFGEAQFELGRTIYTIGKFKEAGLKLMQDAQKASAREHR